MSNNILIKYVLDRSGSMGVIWNNTISGFNEFKNEQAKQDGKAYITLSTFDQPGSYGSRNLVPSVETVIEAKDASEVEDLDPNGEIQPRGMTPLLDAIGIAIEEVDDWLVSKENKDFDGKILFVINTDGYENASMEFTLDGVKKLIKDREEKGWTFVFMGAGIDAFAEAAQFGIKAQNAHSYAATPQSASTANTSLSASTTTYRGTGKFEWESDESDS